MTETIRVEVACALPDRQRLVALQVPLGTTVAEAVSRAGMAALFPELDIPALKLGIYGKVVPPTTVLQAGDRVELYRPLKADPKEVRRQRVEANRGGRQPASANPAAAPK
ncbi:Putative antitoxin component PasI (RatB) of the RatAB toxin-antitoxin module, ubiquitin-RnfH superfamily [Gulbenkiania indica]|uniref:UPF0125 protein Ga0061063_0314 n=1 Tax=Gulbenkiania indica TaxID=375574 RepID=A0A0K6GS60_9NEIS|nr:RnfH family protein [Gulbenkiania indica]CUA81472.1 Putative antitoxin component PasI (RatB) of the RatAB toxin-antitoxin module, ubiquitin-RnfH superfamily [Gulbenkiania indica]